MLSNKQNFENEVLDTRVTLLKIKIITIIIKKLKLKIKLFEQKFKNQVCRNFCKVFPATKSRYNFFNPSTGSREILTGTRTFFNFAFNETQENWRIIFNND